MPLLVKLAIEDTLKKLGLGGSNFNNVRDIFPGRNLSSVDVSVHQYIRVLAFVIRERIRKYY